jgi:ubiquinone/menaquinone biosynthesis C-methylase UbiE
MFSDDKHNPLGRFDGLASLYAKTRPSYPAQALDWIVEKWQAMPAEGTGRPPIADIGSGTGILTRQLVRRDCPVIGIEPNESMRREAEAVPAPGTIAYRAGRAEETGLPAGSVGAVVAAQTFHWCEPDSSLREFHRILNPGGWTTLLWNISDLSDPLTERFWRILRSASPEPAIVEKAHHLAGQALLTHPLFEEGRARVTPNLQALDEEGLVGRAFSASFAPKECEASERTARQLRELFRDFARDGWVQLLYQTHVFQARRQVGPP